MAFGRVPARGAYPNMHTDKPLFEGKATIAIARRIYGIPDPNNRQLSFL